MIVLTVLLTVLKTIGWILLILLGIVLLLIILVLAVPVRYRLRADIPDRKADPPGPVRITAELSWLVGAVSYRCRYGPPGDSENSGEQPDGFRFLFFHPGHREKHGKRAKVPQQAASPHAMAEHPSDDRDRAELDQVISDASVDDWEKQPEGRGSRGNQPSPEKPFGNRPSSGQNCENPSSPKESCENLSSPERISRKTDTGSRSPREKNHGKPGLRSVFRRKVSDGGNPPEEKGMETSPGGGKAGIIVRLIRMLFGEEMAPSRRRVLRAVKGILRDIFPRKGKIRLRFGLGDPAETGQVLAILAAVYPVFRGNLDVTPDFDNAVLEGTADVSGRVIVGVILFWIFLLLTDRRLRNLIAEARKEFSDGR